MEHHQERAKVFMSGRTQAVRIPAAYRCQTDEVYIRRDAQTGDLVLSAAPLSWEQIFAALDAANFPDDFLADRDQDPPQERPGLFD